MWLLDALCSKAVCESHVFKAYVHQQVSPLTGFGQQQHLGRGTLPMRLCISYDKAWGDSSVRKTSSELWKCSGFSYQAAKLCMGLFSLSWYREKKNQNQIKTKNPKQNSEKSLISILMRFVMLSRSRVKS